MNAKLLITVLPLVFRLCQPEVDYYRSDTVIVATTAGSVYAMSSRNGGLKWTFQAKDAVISSVISDERRIFVASTDKNLYALDPLTGELLWKFTADASIRCTPIDYRGMIIFGAEDGMVYCVDASKGFFRWKFMTTEGYAVRASPALGEEEIYIAGTDGKIYALDPITGNLRWSLGEGISGPIEAGPCVYNGRLLFATMDNKVYDYFLEYPTLTELLRAGQPVSASPVTVPERLVIGSHDGYVYGLRPGYHDAFSWKFDTGSPVFQTPLIYGAFVYAASGVSIFKLGVGQGNAVNVYELPASVTQSSLIFKEATIYAATSDDYINAIDEASGRILWRFKTDGEILASPCIIAYHGAVTHSPISGKIH